MSRILRKTSQQSQVIADVINGTRRTACALKAFGTVTLVAGTATVTVVGMTALAVIALTLTAHGGTAGTRYKIVPSAGQFIVTAVDTAGAAVTTDTSTFNWKAETPTFHADQTPRNESDSGVTYLTVSAANATDLGTSLTLANQLRQVVNEMIADPIAHLAADTTNPVTTAIATDLTTVEALLIAIKVAFNAHLTQSGVHFINDSVNNVSTADATDQTTSNALANALKTKINAHLASAAGGDGITLSAA